MFKNHRKCSFVVFLNKVFVSINKPVVHHFSLFGKCINVKARTSVCVCVCVCVVRSQSQLCVKARGPTETPTASPPVFTCLLIVLIVPLVFPSLALMRFFPVPLGQRSGHRSTLIPFFPPKINYINEDKQTSHD